MNKEQGILNYKDDLGNTPANAISPYLQKMKTVAWLYAILRIRNKKRKPFGK